MTLSWTEGGPVGLESRALRQGEVSDDFRETLRRFGGSASLVGTLQSSHLADEPEAALPEDTNRARASDQPLASSRSNRRQSSGGLPIPLDAGAPLFLVDLIACALAGWTVQSISSADAAGVVATLATIGLLRLYRWRVSFSVLDDVPYLFSAVLVGSLMALVVPMAMRSPQTIYEVLPYRLYESSLLLSLLVFGRGLSYAAIRRIRRSGRGHCFSLIIGSGPMAVSLARNLQDRPEYGVTPVGFVVDLDSGSSRAVLPVPVVGNLTALDECIQYYGADKVMVASPLLGDACLADILRICDRLDCDMFFVPRLFELHAANRDTSHVRGLPLVRVRVTPMRSFSWRLKRLMDVVLGCILLMTLAPVFVIIALAVRVEGGPGVLFRQERVGLNGRHFTVLKFRTMRPLVTPDESALVWSISHDPRLGSVGRRLRRTSLDGLPQIWNVLRGDMSLVGPRAERPYSAAQFSSTVPRYTARQRVPAGVTGLAQIHELNGETSMAERVAYDNQYIETWSLWADIKILLRTVPLLVRLGLHP